MNRLILLVLMLAACTSACQRGARVGSEIEERTPSEQTTADSSGAFRDGACKNIEVSDEEIQAEYERGVYSRPDQVRVFHFFFPIDRDATPEQKEIARAEFRRVLDELRRPRADALRVAAEFAGWTRETAVVAADLGYFAPTILPTEVDVVAFPKDAESRLPAVVPVEAGGGNHVFFVGGRWSGRRYSLAEVRDKIAAQIRDRKCDETQRGRTGTHIPESGAPPLHAAPGVETPAGMVYLAGGRLHIGSTDAEIDARLEACRRSVGDCRRFWFEDEEYREVDVASFFLDEREVTAAEYERFRQGAGFPPIPAFARGADVAGDVSAAGVTAREARAYCADRGKRLPSFAEWQFAARGMERRRFPWGNQPADGTRANYCDAGCARPWRDAEHDDGFAFAAPVMSYPAGRTPEGVWDLAGNVREWTRSLDAGKRVYVPGGSWKNAVDDLWSADVRTVSPWMRHETFGFRCAKDVR